MAIIRIGLDIAKLVFQLHGVDGHGKAVLEETLSRSQMLSYFAKLPVYLIDHPGHPAFQTPLDCALPALR